MAENPPDTDVTEPDPQNEAGIPPDSSAEQGSSLDTSGWRRPEIDPESKIPILKKIKLFCATHYLGIVTYITPIFFLGILYPFPPPKWQWCAYCLCVMAIYWVFECIPLPVTAFLPVIIFPLSDIMSTRRTCQCYMNDTIMLFLGSIILAASVEQSGLHRRIALYAIKCIGYSHKRMLLAISLVTMFISMWITNTAATTMMVPILFALLKVYEDQRLLKIYDVTATGEKVASRLTGCYFCCVTYAATIGGIGTLVGTATNLVFHGLFVETYPNAPDIISFPLFSAWSIPYMLVSTLSMYLCLAIFYMGLGRPNSKAAKKIKITPEGLKAAKKAVDENIKALGKISWHELSVLFLFGGAMILFFSRAPHIFPGWADKLAYAFETETKFIKDSAAAAFVIFLMLLLPASGTIFKNCKAKFADELPKGTIVSVLDWHLMNKTLPYSFCFLLAGGFALSTAAGKKYSNLNGQIGYFLAKLEGLPKVVVLLIVIIVTVFITNFASNVAVCNVITPLAMELAVKLKMNPLWLNVASGVSASMCFMLPVGTPGNLIVQSAAKIPTTHMMLAGTGPTITTILWTWIFLFLYGPIIWPTLKVDVPKWLPTT